MPSERLRHQAADVLREPIDAVVLGVHRSRWFIPVLCGSVALMLLIVIGLDLGVIGFIIGALIVLAISSLAQRQVLLARTPTRVALVRARRPGMRPSRLAQVIDPASLELHTAGPGMQSFTVDGTTYLVSKLYAADFDRVREPR